MTVGIAKDHRRQKDAAWLCRHKGKFHADALEHIEVGLSCKKL